LDVIDEYDEVNANFGEDFDEQTAVEMRIAVRDLRSKVKRVERLSRRHEHVELVINTEMVEMSGSPD
jgi:hypothetical protein